MFWYSYTTVLSYYAYIYNGNHLYGDDTTH